MKNNRFTGAGTRFQKFGFQKFFQRRSLLTHHAKSSFPGNYRTLLITTGLLIFSLFAFSGLFGGLGRASTRIEDLRKMNYHATSKAEICDTEKLERGTHALMKSSALEDRAELLRIFKIVSHRILATARTCPSHVGDKLVGMRSTLQRHLFPWFTSSKHKILFTGSGRGFVMPVYDDLIHLAIANIQLIRARGSGLPIEVFYMGDSDLHPKNRAILQSCAPNVHLRNILELIDNKKLQLEGWSIKPFALLLSSFRESILLDADATFLANPELLFNESAYRATGAYFFPDRLKGRQARDTLGWVRSILPPDKAHWPRGLDSLPFFKTQTKNQQDSSVVVLDKHRALIAVLGACLLLDADTRDITFRHSFGDKESFWLGAGMTATPFAFNPQRIGLLGVPDRPEKPSFLCGAALMQFTSQGRPLYINHGLMYDKRDIESDFVRFEAFAQEPRDPKKQASWITYSPENCMYPPLSQITPLDMSARGALEAAQRAVLKSRQLVRESGVVSRVPPPALSADGLRNLKNEVLTWLCIRRGVCLDIRQRIDRPSS